MIALARKRLLHVVGYAVRGGCERCCEVFIRSAPEFAHSVLVLGSDGPMTGVWQEAGARVLHLDVLGLSWLQFHCRVDAELRQLPFDAAIVWAGIRTPLMVAALSRFDRPVALHAGNPFTAGRRVRFLLRASRLLPQPRSLTVVGCSVHVARTFRRAPYYRHLPVESCLNPIEAPKDNPHRARFLTPSDPVRLGMVARLDPIKDHRTLLQAFGHLRADWPLAELHLAGDGPLKATLEAQARDLGIAEAVRFQGEIGDVPGFLRRLDLFCYFTTPKEGMGNALAEALAHGLPCVVNDLPVMREVGGEQEACAVRLTSTDPKSAAGAMDALLRDSAARKLLSERAHARAGAWFSPRRVVERYLSLMGVQA